MNRPNIILILVDDLGIGDLSCFNPESKIRTGNIDRLAEQGMRSVDCHASSALSTPSRYGLLTGRYNWRSRLKAGVLPGTSFPLIEEGRTTLGSMLQALGYYTACVGKWHLGMNWEVKDGFELPATYLQALEQDPGMGDILFDEPINGGPNTRGFDYFFGMPASLDQPPFVYVENDRVLAPPTRMIGRKELDRRTATMPTDVEFGPASADFDPVKVVPDMDAKVLELVDKLSDENRPFFIYYPTLAVHGPLVPSPDYEGKSGIGLYGDFVLQVDGFVGKLTAMLEKKGIADDTILIFTSDNGCSGITDFPKLHSLGHDSSYIYRGMKADIWEGGHRIPFVVRWPGRIPAGSVCRNMTCLTDIFATLAEITGFEYGDDAGEDSVSLWSMWQGSEKPVREAVIHHSANSYSIRSERWKLEFCAGSGGMGAKPNTFVKEPNPEGTPYQLYDMENDVREQHNLFGEYPETERELTKLAKEYVLNGRSTPGKPQANAQADIWPGLDWMEN